MDILVYTIFIIYELFWIYLFSFDFYLVLSFDILSFIYSISLLSLDIFVPLRVKVIVWQVVIFRSIACRLISTCSLPGQQHNLMWHVLAKNQWKTSIIKLVTNCIFSDYSFEQVQSKILKGKFKNLK